MENPCIITCYTTVGSEQDAHSLIRNLLDLKLIACGVTWKANSFFCWEGKSDMEAEYVVYCKTSLKKANLLKKQIEDLHPYELPCLIYSTLETNTSYLHWVEQQVTRPTHDET